MTNIWKQMTNEEKDELIAKEVLDFYSLLHGSRIEFYTWYKKHYKMGFCHYTTLIDLTFEIIGKLSEQGIKE
ncbi:hypothetical protein [Gottfriedia acidiceleris]|uniref:Uncharacterized protein n=1 Tax=Gottfriedia acidiceleris TaxID=371036 RepID=A0ABY4JU62_9BACI|nr:hypothetical protein [Gottfriedia acidiceleris]UPM56378.1 hypothetical protein MY490_11300 [Gottfriedia acidiceleris]